MTDHDLYNSRIIKTFIEYLDIHYPGLNTRFILDESGMTIYQVNDEGHWFSQSQVDQFHDIVVKLTGRPDIALEAGRFATFSKASGAVTSYVASFLTPGIAYSVMTKLYPQVSKSCSVETRSVKKNQVEITVRQKPGVEEKPYQCANRTGSFEGIAKMMTGKTPQIDHPECMHREGDCCRYLITWDAPRSNLWKKAGGATALLTMILLPFPGYILPLSYVFLYASSAALLIVSMYLRAVVLERGELRTIVKNRGDSAEILLDQINVRYHNVLLMKEIGHYVSSILDTELLLQNFMSALKKNLEFRRGIVLLADGKKNRLVYRAGYGYSLEDEEFIRQFKFSLDNPQSRGAFVICFRSQVPFLISDVNDIGNDLSPRSLAFARKMGVHSFICVPITFEGRSEGVLAVDSLKSDRPMNETDISLLSGIATQIGISINNARVYEELLNREKLFRALSENSPDIIFTTNETGAITYMSPAAEDILKYSPGEMVGKHFQELSGAAESERFGRFFNRLAREGKTVKNFEVKFRGKNGKAKLLFMSGAPDFDDMGNMKGVVGTLRDFTEQRELEQQLHHAERMNALGRLTGGISHDFNNILQAIMSYNQILTYKKSSSDPDWEHLSKISELTKRATDLVGQLLAFSKKIESTLVPLDMNREISRFYELLVGALPKNITLTLDLTDSPALMNGDRGQLDQVIMNLTVNAKDAMPEGGELTIKTRSTTIERNHSRNKVRMKEGEYLLLTISDTGQGISEKDLDRIFDPYYTTKELDKGTGIGLSVCYGIVKSHEGFIFCRSEVNKGTTFDLYFPAIDERNYCNDEGRYQPKPVLLEGHETILLVDDESSLLEAGEELLGMLGYRVLTAESGKKALEIIEREQAAIDLVVLDLMMPGMSGEGCLAEILKIAPAMKVVVASGYLGDTRRETIIEQGAMDFIQKPYQFETLNTRIRDVLARSDQPS